MSTVSHQPDAAQPRRQWSSRLAVPELWASAAIAVMWIAVIVTSIYGGDIATIDAGGASSNVPSGVVVALFAFLGTWVVARSGLRHTNKNDT